MNVGRWLAAMTIACLIGNIVFERLQSSAGSTSVTMSLLHASESKTPDEAPVPEANLRPEEGEAPKSKGPQKKLSILEQFCAFPGESLAEKLLIEQGVVGHFDDEDRIDVCKHEQGWITIFFQRGVEDEEWGVITVSSEGKLFTLRGDRCLWAADELDPVNLLYLDGEETPLLTLLERDGGSGGFEETLRLFKFNKGQWQEAGSIQLSYNWRSGDFPELCGADTPYRQRKAEIEVVDDKIHVRGAQRDCRRLPSTKTQLNLERRAVKFEEVYALSSNVIQRVRVSREPMKKERQTIVIENGFAELQSH
ncbi:MAG: hypothetical protein P1V97_20425 [Planctomycetota bacterium]|nr:hypothetical protein [Planctomycetota bacterium]